MNKASIQYLDRVIRSELVDAVYALMLEKPSDQCGFLADWLSAKHDTPDHPPVETSMPDNSINVPVGVTMGVPDNEAPSPIPESLTLGILGGIDVKDLIVKEALECVLGNLLGSSAEAQLEQIVSHLYSLTALGPPLADPVSDPTVTDPNIVLAT